MNSLISGISLCPHVFPAFIPIHPLLWAYSLPFSVIPAILILMSIFVICHSSPVNNLTLARRTVVGYKHMVKTSRSSHLMTTHLNYNYIPYVVVLIFFTPFIFLECPCGERGKGWHRRGIVVVVNLQVTVGIVRWQQMTHINNYRLVRFRRSIDKMSPCHSYSHFNIRDCTSLALDDSTSKGIA